MVSVQNESTYYILLLVRPIWEAPRKLHLSPIICRTKAAGSTRRNWRLPCRSWARRWAKRWKTLVAKRVEDRLRIGEQPKKSCHPILRCLGHRKKCHGLQVFQPKGCIWLHISRGIFSFSGARVAHRWALSARRQGHDEMSVSLSAGHKRRIQEGTLRKLSRNAPQLIAKVVPCCIHMYTLWMPTFLGYQHIQQIQPFDYVAIGGGGRWTSELWGVLHAGQGVERQRRLGVSKDSPFKRQKVVVYVYWNLSSRPGELKFWSLFQIKTHLKRGGTSILFQVLSIKSPYVQLKDTNIDIQRPSRHRWRWRRSVRHLS